MRTQVIPGRWPSLSFAQDGGGGVGASNIYTTTFASAENPLSEGGRWILGQTTGVDWGDVQSSGGNAFGKRAQDFRDNTAILSGSQWSANSYVEVVAFVGSPDNSFFPEIELRLRSVITPNVNRGYEIGFGLNGAGGGYYIIVVRWNGPSESFDYLYNVHDGAFVVVNGDTLRGEISGNFITVKKNGVIMSVVDITSIGGTVWTDGAPGFGTNANTGGSGFLNQYGIQSFSTGPL